MLWICDPPHDPEESQGSMARSRRLTNPQRLPSRVGSVPDFILGSGEAVVIEMERPRAVDM